MTYSDVPSLLPFRLLCGLFLSTVPAAVQADSIERLPVSAEEVARELGMEMTKFEAKFDAPVYAVLTLNWKQPGDADARQMQHSSPDPDQYHEILFVRKNFGEMQLKTGGANARQVRDVIEMNVRFGSTGFFYRDLNPFAKIKPGESIQAWTKQQSREALPLDVPIPLAISAGPLDPSKPALKLREEYTAAPAYICLTVTFSRTAPAKPAEAPPAASPAGKPQ